MNKILFIGGYESPLAKERYKIIKSNINNEKIVFFNTSFKSYLENDIINTKFFLNKYFTNIIQFIYLLFVIFKYRINIIHFHGAFHAFINFIVFFITKRTKIIVTVQGSEINQNYKGYKKKFVKYLLDHSNYITVKSNFMKKKVKEISSGQADIVDLNWGIDDDLFTYKSKQLTSKINIISYRATNIIYNIDKIFYAINKLKEKNCNINFTYIEFNRNPNIQLDLSIVDNHYKCLDKKELITILSKQDIMISIPSYDGFATSIMESLSLGVLPIISNIESYSDENLDENSIIIDLNKDNELVDKLYYSIDSIKRLHKDRSKRIAFAKKNYSRTMQIEVLKKIYS